MFLLMDMNRKQNFSHIKLWKSFFFLKGNAGRVYIHGSHSFAEVVIGEPEGKVPCFTDFYPFHFGSF